MQRNTMKGEMHVYEDVDWSKTGPWHHHRRLFGLNEFAGIITTLAMQKPGTDIRDKILPHHVFQLQCIVDSRTSSRVGQLVPCEATFSNNLRASSLQDEMLTDFSTVKCRRTH